MTQETALHLMKSGHSLFLTGAPGTGKTYVINEYLNYLKDFGIQAAVTAPTGIAASHIGGQTIHSFFGLGIKERISQYELEALTEKKYLWENMKNLKILIIDEVSMLSPETFKSLDRILKTFKFSQESFGGIQVILVGDFFQLPPIRTSSQEERFIFQTDLWREMNLKICYLEESHRHDDEVLLGILEEIRRGEVSEESMEHFRKRYRKTPQNLEQLTKLYTHNSDVDAINQAELDRIDEPLKSYEAHTTGQKKWAERIFSSSLVLPKLELKKGALVFFIKNNYEKNYINGTLGTIVDFDVFDTPIVETPDGNRIKAERVEWSATDSKGKQKASVKQIPLRLAWAITIHKSQGMTLSAAEIDLSKAFEPGQGYVALSRIKNIEGLKLMGLGKMALQVDSEVHTHDGEFKKKSHEIENATIQKTDEEKMREHESFMDYLGGSIEKAKQKHQKEQSTKEHNTYLSTKKLLDQKMSIEDIARKRNLSANTIIKHIHKILTEDSEYDITHLQPASTIIEEVEKAKELLEREARPDHFSESGELKLKAIFTQLDEKISYEDIKKALLFL